MNYGAPYKGSKSRIAEKLINFLPKSTHFYDVFGGGGAITHCVLLSNKWKYVHYNELEPLVFNGIKKAFNGGYKNENRWISREDFFKLKDNDFYVASCWSFGNCLKAYMYAEEIEPYKKAFHYAAVFGDYSLFNVMGIYLPKFEELKTYERKIALGRWLLENKTDVKTKYIKYWLSLVDKEKRHYEEIYGYVLRGEDINLKCKEESERLRNYLINALKEAKITQSEVDRRLGNKMSHHYFGRSQWAFPTYEEYKKMQVFMPALKDDYYTLTKYYTIIKSLERLESLQSLQSLESLQRLQRLESLQRLQRLERLEFTNLDYRSLKFEPNSVIYCDPPYKGTSSYLTEFNHEEFYDWCESVARREDIQIFISEYEMP